KHLSVENYALIDKLDIDFSEGLTIITGETGAGKSILIGALSLILGQRADIQALHDKTKKCIVEGTFKIEDYPVKSFFEQNNLDYDDLTVIRREVNPAGKSRAFINDTPVSLSQIKDLTQHLIDIHSQHETLTITDSQFQLDFIDSFAKNNTSVNNYRTRYKQYKQLLQQYNESVEKEKQAKADLDYNQFLFNELETSNLKLHEQEELEKEAEALTHSEEIKSNLSKASLILNDSENNVLIKIAGIRELLAQIVKYFPEVNEIHERINNVNIELKELSRDIENIESKVASNPERIEEISQRLDVIYHLQQKHKVQNIEGLLGIKDLLNDKLLHVTSLEDEIRKLEEKINLQKDELLQSAKAISEKRNSSFTKIRSQLEAILVMLGMPDAVIEIKNLLSGEFNENGIDRINFLFSANKGSEPKELSKVASGGEMSRLMLAIKSLISQRTLLPTIIFDEVDQGVSGNVADKVGAIMKKMTSAMQVISITHLPQIASKANVHYIVYKETDGNTTKTQIRKLNEKQRVEEIAKMLSGKDITTAAIENAKVLMEMK
ncbi:MAG: DNA repair protein RecN, partial [Bacteroidales bacterium]|nr:DNA repair protein RecN [Bacteroidales bacterium]